MQHVYITCKAAASCSVPCKFGMLTSVRLPLLAPVLWVLLWVLPLPRPGHWGASRGEGLEGGYCSLELEE
jgi:hypothetical protein